MTTKAMVGRIIGLVLCSRLPKEMESTLADALSDAMLDVV